MNKEPHEKLGRALAPLVTLLVLAGAATTFLFAHFAFDALDGMAAENLRQRVTAALAVERKRLEDLNVEYSFWDLSHAKLIEDPDPAWAEANIGPHLTERYGLSLAVAMQRKQPPTIAFRDGVLVGSADELHVLPDTPGEASGYWRVDDTVYLYASYPFIDEQSETAQPDDSRLFFARRITDGYLAELAGLYHLPPLALVDPAATDLDTRLVLPDSTGAPVAALAWASSEPSQELLNRLILPSLITSALVAWMAWLVIHHDTVNRRRFVDKLLQVASKDFLTGISNRREFITLAGSELARAQRDGSSICLLLIDVDHFKQVNDTFGHEVGDAVLQGLAQQVAKALRRSDQFARWGGEEFIVLLPQSNAVAGLETAERLRLLVASGKGSTPEVACTVSIGGAVWDGSETLESLISRADRALYKAKVSGRNQTQFGVPHRAPFEPGSRQRG